MKKEQSQIAITVFAILPHKKGFWQALSAPKDGLHGLLVHSDLLGRERLISIRTSREGVELTLMEEVRGHNRKAGGEEFLATLDSRLTIDRAISARENLQAGLTLICSRRLRITRGQRFSQGGKLPIKQKNRENNWRRAATERRR